MSYNSKYTGAEVEALLDAANDKQDKIEDLDAIREGASKGATALQSVPSEYVTESELTNKGYATTSALDDKVDKVSGKQLSTEDFTSALKTKLEGLSNYDDTELSEALSTLRGDFDKLVSGDTTTAIKTFNEVIAFLDGVQDTQDLSSIIASIEQQIAGKQATISDLDTIRAGAAKGATALQSYTEKYTGTITGIKMNGASKGTSGVVDLGTVITSHQDISGKADKSSLATVATSGSYNDLTNKPTIPAEQVNADWNATSGKAQILNKPTIPTAVTESTVSGWGFTKNTGTYSKPSGGIPKSDLASTVQTSLGKADTALQSYTEQYKGTITGVAINGTAIATSGVAYIPSASTESYGTTKLNSNTNSTSTAEAATPSAVKAAYDLANGKQDKLTSGTNIKTINGQSLLGSGNITIDGGSGGVSQEAFDSLVNTVDNIDADVAQLTKDVQEKQDKLVSGTNIKTINGESLIGEGDITISGGGGGGKEYVVAPLMTEPTGTSINFTPSILLEPNKVYVAKKKVSTINMIFISIPSDSIGAEYTIMFQASTSELSIVLDTSYSYLWANGAIPTIEADTYYELSLVLNNINNTYIFKAVLTPFKSVE